MGGGVVGRGAWGGGDMRLGARQLAAGELALADSPVVDNVSGVVEARVVDDEDTARGANDARITDLTAAFGIEGRGFEDHLRVRERQDARLRLMVGPRQELRLGQVARP